MDKKKNLTIDETFNLAIKNHQTKNLNVAKDLYNQVLAINPNHMQALNNLGNVLEQLREYQEAINCYEKTIGIDPNFAGGHNNIGIIFKTLGDNHKAITFYEKAIEIDPNYTAALYNLGVVLQELREDEKAKNYYKKAIEIDPNYSKALNNLGVIFKDLGEYLKAKDCHEKAIKINPNFAEAYYNLATTSLKLEDVKSYNTYLVKFYQLKSIGIISNANLDNVIPKLVKKLHDQNRIPTFFDNNVISQLTSKNKPTSDFCDIFEKGQLSIENRFVTYPERIKNFSKILTKDRLFDELPFMTSQGVHSLIKWKEQAIYKTTFDLTIYSMLLQEVRPEVIIELGSGSGGSAIWLADTAAAIGLDTHIYSFDINKPIIDHKKVTFIQYDLNEINKNNKPPYWDLFKGKKIIIEDAHVNLKNVLHLFDTILEKDDYLIIEDSEQNKQSIISNFMNEKKYKYKVDQFFLDFFGRNITCCMNSIFKLD